MRHRRWPDVAQAVRAPTWLRAITCSQPDLEPFLVAPSHARRQVIVESLPCTTDVTERNVAAVPDLQLPDRPTADDVLIRAMACGRASALARGGGHYSSFAEPTDVTRQEALPAAATRGGVSDALIEAGGIPSTRGTSARLVEMS
jgi:hypothetical protein